MKKRLFMSMPVMLATLFVGWSLDAAAESSPHASPAVGQIRLEERAITPVTARLSREPFERRRSNKSKTLVQKGDEVEIEKREGLTLATRPKKMQGDS